MGIHNYELMYQTAKENVRKAAFSERNKELITDVQKVLMEKIAQMKA